MINGIRLANRGDADAVLRLLQTAVYQHVHVDWYTPGDWLGSPGFVVVPQAAQSVLQNAAKFMGVREKLLGCLAAAADVLPVAWVRVMALAEQPEPEALLAAMMSQVTAYLQQRHITELAWLVVDDLPSAWLERMGFLLVNEIETYMKEDTAVCDSAWPNNMLIRPVTIDDVETLAALEATAFDPLWRHSAHALRLAYEQALSFDLVSSDDEIIAFQLSSRSESGAHLVRMTVHPAWQNKGVGSTLLAHTLNGYYHYGLQTASLNTQVDNIPSQALYQKFGFRASGFRLPVWRKELNDDQI